MSKLLHRRRDSENLITLDDRLLKQKIEARLKELKSESPDLARALAPSGSLQARESEPIPKLPTS